MRKGFIYLENAQQERLCTDGHGFLHWNKYYQEGMSVFYIEAKSQDGFLDLDSEIQIEIVIKIIENVVPGFFDKVNQASLRLVTVNSRDQLNLPKKH